MMRFLGIFILTFCTLCLKAQTNDSIAVVEDSVWKSLDLQEVQVVARQRLAKHVQGGLLYNMKGNRRAQKEYLLTALGYVPLVKVSNSGEITVRGNKDFTIFLNGRPYDMAQASPKEVLRTIKASDVASVEVITNAQERFGIDVRGTVLNITTARHALDGFAVSAYGDGNTQPSANAGISFQARQKAVDFSVSYDYGLNGQRNQPVTQEYTFTDRPDEKETLDGNGDGDWSTHTMRAMMNWKIDSLNTLYVDGHGKLNNTDLTTSWSQNSIKNDMGTPQGNFTNLLDNWSGTVEANVIYRNYFRHNPSLQRFVLGYRYTYNPDKRHFKTEYAQGEDTESGLQETDGGMNEHTLLADWCVPLRRYGQLHFAAKGILRNGHSASTYLQGAETLAADDDMAYRQNVFQGYVAWQGAIKALSWSARVRLEQSHFSMSLPSLPQGDYKHDKAYLLPLLSITVPVSRYTELDLSYEAATTRPSIQQLNPFRMTINDYQYSQGNPTLNPQLNHTVTLSAFTARNQYVVSLWLKYAQSNNVILAYKQKSSEGDALVCTYGNIGKTDILTLGYYAQWQPFGWMNLSANGEISHRWLRSSSVNLHQREWIYSCTPSVDFYLPKNWTCGMQYGVYKNFAEPWSDISTLQMYSAYVRKSFFDGALTVGLQANSPFEKYSKSISQTHLTDVTMHQTNWLTARSFGINLSYTFHHGKKAELKRDTMVRNSDVNTGV